MSSDPALLEAFRRQCRTVGPGMAFFAWLGQEGVEVDDLIDVVKEFDRWRSLDAPSPYPVSGHRPSRCPDDEVMTPDD